MPNICSSAARAALHGVLMQPMRLTLVIISLVCLTVDRPRRVSRMVTTARGSRSKSRWIHENEGVKREGHVMDQLQEEKMVFYAIIITG